MNNHWKLHAETGFLLKSQPNSNQSHSSGNQIDYLRQFAEKIPDYLANQNADDFLKDVAEIEQVLDASRIDDPLDQEDAFRILGYLASAWVLGLGQTVLPRQIAVPYVQIAARLDRPPMLSYAGQVLTNWQLKDPDEGFTPHNILLHQTFTHLVDESWFFRVHVAIEAQSGPMLTALSTVNTPIAEQDDMAVLDCLRALQRGLVQITKTFHNMPDLCDPDVYYDQIRPYIMSFDGSVVYEDVDPNPTPLRGGSGAQSSVVPALLAGLGIAHESTALTSALMDMRRYMPKEHRAFIADMGNVQLRSYCAERPALRDAYNHVLRQLMTFRRAHLYYARTYIFEKSTNPIGSGGTSYLDFLSKLIDETTNYLL